VGLDKEKNSMTLEFMIHLWVISEYKIMNNDLYGRTTQQLTLAPAFDIHAPHPLDCSGKDS